MHVKVKYVMNRSREEEWNFIDMNFIILLMK